MTFLKKFLAYFVKFCTILLIGISFVLVIIILFQPEWVKIAIVWIEELVKTLGNWNYFIAFSSAFLESLPLIGILVPGMNVMIIVGGFWGKLHLIGTLTSAVLGAMLGNYIGYWMGKKYGISLIENYGDYMGLGNTERKILEKQIKKNGFWYIVLGKFHNFTRTVVPFIAGISLMKEGRFWIYNTIGSIIWAVSINLLGIFFIDRYEVILDNFGKILFGMLILIIGYFLLFKRESLTTYIADKNKEIEARLEKK